MVELNYKELGLKTGLEVHQQLDTGKLFIRTPSKLSDEIDFTIERKLRPVASELGEFDKTALDAFKRKETFYYSGSKENISLVELDEEPPQPIDKEAMKTVLEIASLCNSNIVSKAQVMRKTVIDGSNTSAFQRTMLLSLGGKIIIDSEKNIGVETIILEEDAARPIKKENGKIYYNLDRLGIPLIELATAPDITTPEEAVETAKKIGELFRLTGKTKRGKGTIRQDVNVSIAKGNRCEIKGCQELEQIGTVVKKEIERQIDLLRLKEKLNDLVAKPEFGEIKEITQIFSNTNCKFIKEQKVFGMKLKNMKGFLGEKVGEKRFGSELSAYAKVTGVSGLMHRDELPAYGIDNIEVDKIRQVLDCGEKDNFIIIVAEKERAFRAFGAVKERIFTAFEEVPKETRGALEDGSSEYQRPLAGGARMYPETDLTQEEISESYLEEIKKELPRSVKERKKLYAKLGLSGNHIEEMKLNNYARFFEKLVEKGVNASVASTLLLQTMTELKREGIETNEIEEDKIEELLLAEKDGRINKNNLKGALKEIVNGKTIEEILKKQVNIDENEVQKIIEKVVKANEKLVKEKKFGAIGALMGDLMKEKSLKGIDGKILSELLKKEIGKVIK